MTFNQDGSKLIGVGSDKAIVAVNTQSFESVKLDKAHDLNIIDCFSLDDGILTASTDKTLAKFKVGDAIEKTGEYTID